ncbi:MAG: hypothetical protein RLZZ293_928 [Pseudomonadota bacterium]|jgi:hypothetical protein
MILALPQMNLLEIYFMKKIALSLSLISIVATSHALENNSTASVSPVYFNINTGWATLLNLPTGSWTGSANLGYNFNQYFALEAGYNLLANHQYNDITTTTNIFDLAAKITIPTSSIFSLYTRAGLGIGLDGWGGTAPTTAPSWFLTNDYHSVYTTSLLGLGGSFNLSRHFAINLEDYALIPLVSTMSGAINVVNLGVQYNF